MSEKLKVLICEDNALNRELLCDLLSDDFDVVEACNGLEAIKILEREADDISILLLDINMPVMDGLGVLEVMRRRSWICDVPVIMISSETDGEIIRKTYELGAFDFISRPFDFVIVHRRIKNAIALYSRQKKLIDMVAEQMYERERNNRVMINILSGIVEFRNGESGLHVLHVSVTTEILLKKLREITDKYELSDEEIEIIGIASALHDIGKMGIPDNILNKPGRLTPEEFAIMKTHSALGADMLDELHEYNDEPLVKKAREICRWHHERYDGRGYPDGLKGDEIPISAQVVALSDVYDALTSERCYKKAFSHEKSMEMILNGECGTFNPLLIECFKLCQDDIRNGLNNASESDISMKDLRNEVKNMLNSDEKDDNGKQYLTERNLREERMRFLLETSSDLLFVYIPEPSTLLIESGNAERYGLERVIINPKDNANIKELLGENCNRMFSAEALASLKYGEGKEVEYEVGSRKLRFSLQGVFSSEKLDSVVGRLHVVAE